MTEPATTADQRHMRRALALAERGWGRVHPNPLVGAVVVAAGEVVGEGHHAEFGAPHAEAVALEAAGERARGATLYATLEPCAHEGKTPACTDAIRAAGVSRVVYAAADPHPEAAGGGAALRAAGVEVVDGVLHDAARHQNAAFFHAIERSEPYLALKFGLSLDARIAAAPGRRTTVTGPESWREVHRLRAGFDAILVGAGTVRVDDPSLTVRGEVEPRTPPARVVIDTDARLPLDARLVRTLEEAPTIVVCADDADASRVEALERSGVRVLRAPRRSDRQSAARGSGAADGAAGSSGAVGAAGPVPGGGVDLTAALAALWDEGVRSILCEGGGRLAASLLGADRVERLHLFYAPRLLGEGAVPAFPVAGSSASRRLVHSTRRLGNDVLVTLDRDRAERSPGDATVPADDPRVERPDRDRERSHETPGDLAGYDS